MNFMEEQQHLFELHIDPAGLAALSETAKWGKFLSIVGFILTGLLVIAAFTMGTLFASLGSVYGTTPGFFTGGFIMVMYLFIAALFFIPNLYLFFFANRLKKSLVSNDQELLSSAFAAQRTVFKFMGIVTIIYLALVALGMVIGIGAAVMTRR